MSKKPRKTSQVKHTTVPTAAKKPAAKPVAETAPAIVATAIKASAPAAEVTPVAPAAPAEVKSVKADAQTIKSHVAALRDTDADTAREAATTLGSLGDASAVEPLIEALRNTDGYFHSVVRSAAAASLAQLKDARAVDPLLDAISDPIADPSSEAIRALAAIGNARAVAALIDVVRNHSGFFVTSVRRAAVLGLIQLGGEEAAAELRSVAADEFEDTVIRDEAAAATR